MITRYLPLVFIIFSIGCSSKNEKKTTIDLSQIKMFEVEKHKYETNNNDSIVKENIITQIFYEGEKINDSKTEKIYKYNDNGNLKSIETFDFFKNNREKTEVEIHSSDFTETFWLQGLDTVKYKKELFSNGLLAETIIDFTFTNPEMNTQNITTYEYNAAGNIIKTDLYSLKRELLTSHLYAYEKTKNFVRLEIKDKYGKSISLEKKFFNNYGLYLKVFEVPNHEIDSFSYKGNLLIKSIYHNITSDDKIIIEFDYDKNKRLIESRYYTFK